MIKLTTILPLKEYMTGNRFEGGGTDIIEFLNSKGGIMETIKDELKPAKYKITIKIKKI